MQSNRGVKGCLVKYLILKADLNLCCGLVLVTETKIEAWFEHFFLYCYN